MQKHRSESRENLVIQPTATLVEGAATDRRVSRSGPPGLLHPPFTNVTSRLPVRSGTAEPRHWRDRYFLDLLIGYRGLGGLCREAELLRRFGETEAGRLACRAAPVRLWWADEHWMPSVQFLGGSTEVHPAIAAAIAELRPGLDEWDAARWLIAPNDWLGLNRPIDLVDREPTAVVEAARADRYVATG